MQVSQNFKHLQDKIETAVQIKLYNQDSQCRNNVEKNKTKLGLLVNSTQNVKVPVVSKYRFQLVSSQDTTRIHGDLD